jgi:hypothetical protein
MKVKYWMLLSLAAMLTWTGCHDILDKKDLQSVNYEDVWNSDILATAYLDKLYRDNMPGWNTEVATFSDESTGGGEIKRGELQINPGTSEDGNGFYPITSENWWKYNEIYRINILLDNLNGVDNTVSSLPVEKQKELRAQALFLRAWDYYNLIIRYGGVPYIKKTQDRTKDDLMVFRDKTSDCVQWVCDDLDEAAASLPSVWASTADFGRITKGAALALKGRMLMFWASDISNPSKDAQRWTSAYNACLAAKDELAGPGGRELNADFLGIWGDTHTKETVMTTRYKYPSRINRAEAGIRPLDLSQAVTNRHRPTLEMALAFPMKDGKIAGASAYASAPFDPAATDETGLFWLNRDPRFYATIVTNGCYFPLVGNSGTYPNPEGRYYIFNGYGNGSPTDLYSRKFLRLNKTPAEVDQGDLDWIEIRYAEVLLNLAECAAETNKLQEAHDIMKDIRKRAGIEAGDGNYGLPALADMSRQGMIDAVMFERRIEMAFEGIRFWDMRRKDMFRKAPFNSGDCYQHRLRIMLVTPLPEGTGPSVFINREFGNAADIEAKLNTVEYFKYFTTTVELAGQPYIVPDRCAGFWAIPLKHFEQNNNIAQTKGWDKAPGQQEFDPLL